MELGIPIELCPKLTEEEKTFKELTIKQCGYIFHFSYGALLWCYPGG